MSQLQKMVGEKRDQLVELRQSTALTAGVARSVRNFAEALVKDRSRELTVKLSNGELLKEWVAVLVSNGCSEDMAEPTLAALVTLLSKEVAGCAAAAVQAAATLEKESVKLEGKAELLEETIGNLLELDQTEEG